MNKVVVVIVSVGLALSAALFSYANSFKGGNVSFVANWPLRPAPLDARIAKLLLEKAVRDNRGLIPSVVPQEVILHSLAGFRLDPTDQSTVALLGLSIKDRVVARRLFESSFALNKRQVITAAWLADDSARRGDVDATVLYYDTILKRDNEQSLVVLRELVKLLHNQKAVPIMVALMRKDSSWRSRFWAAAANDLNALPNVALVRGDVTGGRDAEAIISDELLLTKLIDADLFNEAWSLYSKLRPELVDHRGQSDSAGEFGFAKKGSLAPFSWVVPNDRGDLGSFIDADGRLNVSVIGLASGVLARRLARVYSQITSLTFQVDDPQLLHSGIRFVLETRCVENPKLNRRAMSSQGQGGQFRFDVNLHSEECGFAWFELSIVNEREQGVDIVISDLKIE